MVLAYGHSELALRYLSFFEHTIGAGSVVDSGQSRTLDIDGCTFAGNTGGPGSDLVSTTGFEELRVRQSHFAHNMVNRGLDLQLSFGATSDLGSLAVITDTEFHHNGPRRWRDTHSTGVVQLNTTRTIYGSPRGVVMRNVDFFRNSGRGHSVMKANVGGISIQMDRVSVRENVTYAQQGDRAGAIHIDDATLQTGLQFIMRDVDFIGNIGQNSPTLLFERTTPNHITDLTLENVRFARNDGCRFGQRTSCSALTLLGSRIQAQGSVEFGEGHLSNPEGDYYNCLGIPLPGRWELNRTLADPFSCEVTPLP